MRLAACALATGVLVLVPAAVRAAPGNDTFIEAQTFAVDPGQSQSAYATCPGSSRVVSGGVSAIGATPEGMVVSRYDVQLSGPLDATRMTADTGDGDIARHWFAYVFNRSADPVPFKVFAVCSRTSDAVVSTTEFSLSGLSAGAASAECPGGTRAVGGGLGTTGPAPDATPNSFYTLMLSGPRDETGQTASTVDGDIAREWNAYVWNGNGGPQVFKAFALCSATSEASLAVTELTVPGLEMASRAVRCPPSSARVVGGGIHTTGPTPGGQEFPYDLDLSGPLDETGTTADTESGDVPRVWYQYFGNRSLLGQPIEPRLFKLFAVCAPEEPLPGGGDRPGGGPGGGGPGGPGGGGPGGGGPGGGKRLRCDGKLATIVGTNRGETLRGTRRRDVIVALGGKDRVLAGRGNDTVCGGTGNDRIDGALGNDKLIGGDGKDTLLGAAGRDALLGGAGKDKLTGGPGTDKQKQ